MASWEGEGDGWSITLMMSMSRSGCCITCLRKWESDDSNASIYWRGGEVQGGEIAPIEHLLSLLKSALLRSLLLRARICRRRLRSALARSMSDMCLLRMLLGMELTSSVAFLAARLKVFCGTRNSSAPIEFISWAIRSVGPLNFLKTSSAKACRALFWTRPVSKWEWSLVLTCSSDSA